MNGLDSEFKNQDPEFLELGENEVDEIRRIDLDQLSEEAIRIVEREEIIIDGELLEKIFMQIYEFYEELFDEGTFLDDLHEECELEKLNIPFSILEAALKDVLEENEIDILDNRDRLYTEFVTQLSQRVTIR